MNINIAEDYTEYPGGRYPADGDGNGADFRSLFLVPVLEADNRAVVVLDGTKGYPSSFLEEAFGGLVRMGYDADKVLGSFKLEAKNPSFKRFIPLIEDHVRRAGKHAKSV